MGAAEFIGRLQTGEELVRMSFDLAAPAAELAADPKALDVWVHCLPGGPDIVARDGRRFRVEDLAAVVRNTELPLLVDWEHRSDGDDTRAAGWIEELQVRPDGLWGRARWTPSGREHVVKQDYRFLSPVVFGTRDAKKVLSVVKLGAVALTNRPALKLRGIEMLREQLSTRHGAFAPDDGEPTMKKLTALIAAACGLEPSATEDDLVQALTPKLQPKKKAEDDGEVTASLKEACTTLTSERNALQTKLADAEKELLSFRGEAFKAQVETFFADGARAGKIQPANREQWMKFALESETNFSTFKDVIYPGLTVVGTPQGTTKTGKAGRSASEKLRGKSPDTGIDYDALKAVGMTDKQILEAERDTFRSKFGGVGAEPADDEDEDDEDDDGDTTDKEGAPAGA